VGTGRTKGRLQITNQKGLNCAETLHDSTIAFAGREIRGRGTNRTTGFHFLTPGGWEWVNYLRRLNKYQFLKDSKRFIERYIRNFGRKLGTNMDMDKNSIGNISSSTDERTTMTEEEIEAIT